MNFDELATQMTPDVYSRLRSSVELGRWPTGQALSKEQKALCLEAIIKYEIANNVPETERTGYIEQSCKSEKPEQIPTQQIETGPQS